MASMEGLQQLFENELRDVYDAERQIVKALPKMIKAATNQDLRGALESHLEETREQVTRLEQVFETLDMKVRGKHCPGMAGILEEGKELMEEDGAPAVMDAGFIAAAQRVEHYEIGAYGTLIAWGQLLGHTDAVSMLNRTLEEEKAADKKLSAIAERSVNREAMQGEGMRAEGASAASSGKKTRAAGRS
jgi:ferritin-like metal-binding protein YciE